MFIQKVAFCFFFNDTATTEIYTLSLHDALPIFVLLFHALEVPHRQGSWADQAHLPLEDVSELGQLVDAPAPQKTPRSEEHTSELQSRQYLVCRLLLEKKKNPSHPIIIFPITLTT